MDHNLEDALNLDSAIGEMDFESADVVVSQADISLDTSTQEDIAMEFEHIEEQPILMDSGNEEIIVTDFMADQFNLQEYSIHDDQTSEMTTTEDSNQQNILASHTENVDVQFESQEVAPSKPELNKKPKYVAIKAAPRKSDIQPLSVTREIAIAPKLPKLIPAVSGRFTIPQSKPVAIAPQPVALVTNPNNFMKKIPLSSVLKEGNQGGTVLAQIGKQLLMMPASASGQKIKLVTSNNAGGPPVQYIKTSTDHGQMAPAKTISGMHTNKPVVAKVVLQGQTNPDNANQTPIITKLLPTSSGTIPQTQTRYIMQRKTVPISTGKREVVMATPTKEGIKFTKKEQNIYSFKLAKAPKLMPVTTTSGAPPKVVLKPNITTPGQNVILKTSSPQTLAQDGKLVIQGQRPQLHQVNVPGKGIQYITLVSNQTKYAAKKVGKLLASSANRKSFVISDNKGKLVQVSGAPPPLVFNAGDKRPQKLVRIAAAPLTVKSTPVAQTSVRSAQSLLAPLTSAVEEVSDPALTTPVTTSAIEDSQSDNDVTQGIQLETVEEYEISEAVAEAEDIEMDSMESKEALQSLVATENMQREQIEQLDRLRKQQSQDSDNLNSHNVEHLVPTGRGDEHPLIVISSNYVKQEGDSRMIQEDDSTQMENSNECFETEILVKFPLTNSPSADENDAVTDFLKFKPRRACNCTKSKCLKLYCDCFANGEFCNSCNCNHCHNNLNYEELRQKAIRACLERNPNAFRPKIGKTKEGGPEIIRRHNKGCNCKRSGCLKNYCECYEAKIACTAMCKCVGCRNVEEGLHRRHAPAGAIYRPPPLPSEVKPPCSFMTMEVIEAVCQCLIAASVESGGTSAEAGAVSDEPNSDPVRAVLEEFSRCLQDVITASHHATQYEEPA